MLTSLKFVLLLTPQMIGGDAAAWDAEYHWDFQTGHFDNQSLVPMGRGAVNLMRPGPDGLRVFVPAGKHVESVGFCPRFKVRGDFEITVTYKVLKWTTPESGHGVGPSIYLRTDSEGPPAAALGRVQRADGKHVYATFAARMVDGDRQTQARLFETGTIEGGLRMVRSAETLQYLVADQPDADFRLLYEIELNDEELAMVRISVNQSDDATAADVLLKDLTIRAGDLPHLPSAQSRTAQLYRPRYHPEPRPPTRAWLWSSLGAVVLLIACAAWYWLKQN